MSDIQNIRDRVRKLMAYANDGAASAGEIENAMRHAAGLIDRHHLDASEFQAGEPEKGDASDNPEMGNFAARTGSSRIHAWESTLAQAIATLFGCVKYYETSRKVPLRVDGIAKTDSKGEVKIASVFHFYGPAVEAGEAAELFNDWSLSIATMGVVRWGGAYRGDGARYCEGFADSLLEQARTIHRARREVAAKPLAALPGPDGSIAPAPASITLFDRYLGLKERAAEWLEKDQGIKLGKGTGRGGSRVGSSNAYGEGKSHGAASGFGRKASRPALPGN